MVGLSGPAGRQGRPGQRGEEGLKGRRGDALRLPWWLIVAIFIVLGALIWSLLQTIVIEHWAGGTTTQPTGDLTASVITAIATFSALLTAALGTVVWIALRAGTEKQVADHVTDSMKAQRVDFDLTLMRALVNLAVAQWDSLEPLMENPSPNDRDRARRVQLVQSADSSIEFAYKVIDDNS